MAETMTAYKVTTAPTSEPVSLADAKTYLNVSTSLHDTLIANLVSAARVQYEFYTNTAVITQTITQVWDCRPHCFELAISPVTSVAVYYKGTGLEYALTDDNGEIITDDNGNPILSDDAPADGYILWDASNYILDTISPLARVVKNPNASWPTTGNGINVWKIEYAAGYASAAAVPEDIVSSILLLVGFLYENREDIPIGETNNPKIRSFAAMAFGRRYQLI